MVIVCSFVFYHCSFRVKGCAWHIYITLLTLTFSILALIICLSQSWTGTFNVRKVLFSNHFISFEVKSKMFTGISFFFGISFMLILGVINYILQIHWHIPLTNLSLNLNMGSTIGHADVLSNPKWKIWHLNLRIGFQKNLFVSCWPIKSSGQRLSWN